MTAPPVAFDLDGTLIDNRERQVAVAAAVLAEHGIQDFVGDRFWELKRGGSNTGKALTALGLDRSLADAVHTEWWKRIEDAEWLRLDRMLPGATRALELARAAGHPAVVVTGRRDESAAGSQVSALGLEPLVDRVFVVDPAQATVAKARILGDLEAVGFVGDSETDADAAAAAGVAFAAVSTGQRDASFLASRGIEPCHPRVDEAARALLARLRAA